ncbi:pyridoxamine 5'-phosphate oxidase [Trinickia terrae]|uniref:Pyridoxamine 5'-phosphate oxidase n=1 Tax=Trinickia terrae TaxID=2571161 RepID=A0A4U1I7D1_9BURK|nr:pyridoxamine 5'-phosphate oxidase family protein [Trinickia terrae]TKC89309.1 pyridoxamine 5'-phosphate oxidase [Trinickia terrae]
MKIPAHAPLHLLHRTGAGTLATHSREPQGFPYPTVLPFATDARHRPVVLVSRLAEHARNLQADPRAGFLVAHAPGGDPLSGERVTLVGRFEPLDPSAAFVTRYLRYHPDAERYLALGDFSFWAMAIERLRYIGGFGQMGWLDAADLDPLAPLPDEDEIALAAFFEQYPQRPARLELAGVDRYGADLKFGGMFERHAFNEPKQNILEIEVALADCIAHRASN